MERAALNQSPQADAAAESPAGRSPSGVPVAGAGERIERGGPSYRLGWPERALWLVAMAAGLAAAGLNVRAGPADPDELEHLHAAWLWSQGLRPYVLPADWELPAEKRVEERRFFEHHPPAYWVLLRPLVGPAHTTDLFTLVCQGRAISWAIAAGSVLAAGWLFGRLFGPAAGWMGAGFWAIYCGSSDHAVAIRPDMLMLLLLAVGTVLAVEGCGLAARPLGGRRGRGAAGGEEGRLAGGGGRGEPGSGRVSWWRAVMGGVLLAAAGCVLPKAAFWVASLGAVLAAVGVVYAVRRREKGRLWAVAAVFAGMLLPGLVQLGWIWQFNDLGRFWFCNVVVNGKYSGYLFKNMEILKLAIRWALYWPAVPTFLAAVGIPAIILSQGPLAWPRKLVAAALVVSSGAFVLTVGGPFAQNHLPLLMILCGLGGAGLAAILSRWNIGHRLAASVLVAVLASGCIWTGRDLLDSSLLRASVAPYQYVLNQAKPGDTYIGLTHFNPVFVMDADPTHFAYLLCFHEPADFAAMHRLILKKWPRFVIGFGTPLFVAGQGVRVVQVNNDSDGRQIMRHYQQVNPCVLERRDVLGGQ